MNIHNETKYGKRPKGYRPRNTSETPRTRAGKVYPGGRAMRRALRRLAAATAFYELACSGGAGKGQRSKNADAFTKPGAFKP